MKVALVAASIALAITFSLLSSAQDCVVRPRLISVTGTAEINVAPDEVVLSLGIDSQDKDLAAAKSQHDRRVKELLADARSAGIDSKDIQTSTLEMKPEYSRGRVPKFLYYEVSQTIQLTLKDLSRYEGLITKLVAADVTRIDSVDFRVGETRKFKDEARQKAIQAAKEKAVAMAAELGQTIGKPWQIAEDTPDVFSAQYMANSVSNGRRAAQEESTVAPGQVTISATVHVSFQLE
jgi:uncharacterized protein YggE